MTLSFDREVQEASFHSPLEEFELVAVETEVRTDPLTGRQARIVPESFLLPDGEPDVAEVVEDDEGCFFCPGTVGEATPTYPDWVGFDRGSRGEATSFPNLNPYGAHSNVVALTEAHYLPLPEFSADVFADGLAAALEFVRAVRAEDADARRASVNMNYLPSAGSSIVHPHLQTLVDDRGTTEGSRQVEAARAYREETGREFWADLLAEEAGGDRHAGTTGSVEWLAPFAPKHHYHLVGVADATGVPDPDDAAVADLAAGLAGVLDYYDDVGLNSFNVAWHLVADEPAWRPVVHVVGRSRFDRYYWSDSPFFAVLHDEGVVDVAPETCAADAGEHL